MPFGEDENENIELKKVLEVPKFSFTPKPHYELGEKNNKSRYRRI